MIGKKINQLATELAPVSTDLTIIGDPTTGVSKKITLAQLGAIFSGAVSFYTNLASFPATGDINVIYCAKDTQKLYLWSGSAYVEVFPSQALLDTYQLRSEKGNANGYASLDSQGKVPISQLPSSIMEYKGTWNASTNTPTLANGTGDTGDVYICNVAGTVNFGAGPITFAVGDYVIYSGTIWQRSSGAVGTVTSVAVSRSGDALAITGSPVTTSGTINIGFAGNSTQYINGAGNLVTFPGVINEAQNLITEVYNKTGATLTKGTVVYINGGQGNLPTITKALATGDSTSAQTYGIIRNDITNNNNGYVVVAGRISDLDTQAYTEGTQLYLSPTTAGTFTSTKPYAPQHLVYVGIVVRAHPTQGVVEVKIQNGYELDELHNVAAQTPTNNDGLFWEASTSLWKNKSIATILGYTPQAQLNGTGFVKASGTTITYDNSTYLTTSAAATTYLPLVLSSTTNFVDINGQQFSIYGSAGGYTSGRIIVDPVFSAIGYQNAGVFDGLKILTNGNAEFSNSGVTRFFNQVRFDSTLTNGTYTYTLPGATGTIALVGGAGVGTVTSVGLSVPTGFAVSGSPVTSSGTLALSFDTGYSLPTIVKQNNWDTAYNTRIVTASSPLSFISNTISISQASGSANGFLSSTDWTTFNNKQNALTNPVTGTGTTNYLPKFTGASTIGNSAIVDNSGNIGIGTATTRNIAGYTFTAINGTTGAYLDLYSNGNIAGSIGSESSSFVITSQNSNGISFLTPLNSYSTKMFLNNSGNLGLGVTPSAWANPFKVIEGGGSGFQQFIGFQNNDNSLKLGVNHYYNGSAYVYTNNGLASRLDINADKFIFNTAPSGTAGNAISFTQAMTLNASGNLSIGNTNNTYKLDVSGTGRFTERLQVRGGGAGTSQGGILIDYVGNANSRSWILNNDYNVFGDFAILQSTTQTGSTYTAPFYIKNDGNVGIGTSSPFGTATDRTVLSVNGTTDVSINVGTGGSQRAYLYGSSTYGELGTIGALPLTLATNNNEKMRITSGGNLLVGTTTDYGLRLHVNGNFGTSGSAGSNAILSRENVNSTTYGFFNSGNGNLTVTNSGVANVGYFNMSTGAYVATSDINKKKDFESSTIGLNEVLKLKPTLYRMKTDNTQGKKELGFIAQEVKDIIPMAYQESGDMIGLNFNPIVAALTKAIQELKQELDTLKNK